MDWILFFVVKKQPKLMIGNRKIYKYLVKKKLFNADRLIFFWKKDQLTALLFSRAPVSHAPPPSPMAPLLTSLWVIGCWLSLSLLEFLWPGLHLLCKNCFFSISPLLKSYRPFNQSPPPYTQTEIS